MRQVLAGLGRPQNAPVVIPIGRILVVSPDKLAAQVREIERARIIACTIRCPDRREKRRISRTADRLTLALQPSGPWHDLLRQAIGEYGLETAAGETPVNHFIEWLAEWGRDIRRRQHGLLLLTGHRAKGLEFDHVAVLDGGWNLVNADEDADAPRRLYYVAMTRARQTLMLAQFQEPHEFLEALSGSRSVIRRESVELPPAPETLGCHYVRASLRDVDLGFAGRRKEGHPIHRSIAALSPGDPLDIRVTDQGRRELLDRAGTVVGRLSASFEPPAGTRCRSAEVLAIVRRNLEITPLEYRKYAKCGAWEVVVPELVFEPGTRKSGYD